MARIRWNSVGRRRYEVGLDRGVLYLPEQETAVPWNGLVSVDDFSDTSVEPLYYNGVKYFDYVSKGDYKGTLRAFTYPDEFEAFDGVAESPGNGIFVTGQRPPGVFHLSYRTMIGDDVNGVSEGYKIHVLYNLTAKPSNKKYATMSPSQAAYEFAWELTSVPVDAFNLRPTSHIIFDTTKMHEAAIDEVEQLLYGSAHNDPKIATPDEFEYITETAPSIELVDHGDGTWSAIGSSFYLNYNPDHEEFRIEGINGSYLDPNTYEVSTTELY